MSLSFLYVLDRSWFGLWCFTPLSTIFSYIVAVSFIVLPGENRRLPKVTDKLCYIMLHRVHFVLVGFESTTLVVIGTDCTGSCKSNYHTITTKTVPYCIMLFRSMDIRPNYSASVWHILFIFH